MSHWEAEAVQVADEYGEKFDVVQRQKEKVERLLDPSWAFDCPGCDGLEMSVCELDDDDLDQKRISLLGAVFVECGLVVPRNCLFLTDALCRKQAAEKRAQILHEFEIS